MTDITPLTALTRIGVALRDAEAFLKRAAPDVIDELMRVAAQPNSGHAVLQLYTMPAEQTAEVVSVPVVAEAVTDSEPETDVEPIEETKTKTKKAKAKGE